MAERKRGWHFPANSNRAHYFVDGESLCEEYGLHPNERVWGGNPSLMDSEIILADYDCPVCAKRVWKAAQVRRKIKGGGA